MRDANQDQDHRLALVTGTTGAIGKAIALEIARQPGYRVVLLCLDPLCNADPFWTDTFCQLLTTSRQTVSKYGLSLKHQ
jgi:nucleoside-diphosphate-sugar epimerase